jgi:O-antigen ligase
MTPAAPSARGSAAVRAGAALRWTSVLGIGTIATARCFIVFAPQHVFDVDPASDAVPAAGLAMAGSLWLDGLLLLACALGMFGESLLGRGLNWKLVLLAFIPMPVILWHGQHDLAHLWRGATWAAAIMAAVTAAHLARDHRLRVVLASVLLGAVAALLVRGAAQVSFEHADTVKAFEETKEKFLADRGWAPESPAARIFERRLRQPQPTGWFPSTNIFGSLAAFGFIAWTGMSVLAARLRLQSGWSGAMALLALASAAGVWLTGSKGAIAVALAGLALAIMPIINERSRLVVQRFGSWICIGLVALTLAAIVLRGAALPESFAGDRSLLFRWHYLVASANMFVDAPLTGVGPDGYQDAYTQFRVPRNPEEVQSAHSMCADWLSTVGLAGATWVALIMALVWKSGAAMRDSLSDSAAINAHAMMKTTAIAAACVVILGPAPAVINEWPVLDAMSLMVRGLAIMAFLCAAMMSAFVMSAAEPRAMNWLLAAAAVAVVIHGQIEMTFHYGGSVVWAMCVLGVASAAGPQRASRSVWFGLCSTIVTIAIGLWTCIAGAIPASIVESKMNRAAADLRMPWSDQGHECSVRSSVAKTMFEAYLRNTNDARPLLASTQQSMLAATSCLDSDRAVILESTSNVLDDALRRLDRQALIGEAAHVHVRLAALTGDDEHWTHAINLATDITRRDPHGVSSWRSLGDILWAAGRQADAANAYRHALQNSDNFELDELKQLTEADRRSIQARIDQARPILE